MHLSRRKEYTDLRTVINFVESEESNGSHGYRWMYNKCVLHGLKVTRESIRHILKLVDPRGVEMRSKHRLIRRKYFSQGPNYCWHIDSYDKLKPYGLCINGCVDGFSRKMMWVKVGKTSSDPKVIAKYFIEAIQNAGGYPYHMRGDMGTGNGTVAAMQNFLSRNERDSFIYGKSTLNTRIESWWAILRKQCTGKWIKEMKDLRDTGNFTGNKLDVNLVQFCCMKLLQAELDETALVWDMHRIRRSRSNLPDDRPIALYLLPELWASADYVQSISDDELEICKSECAHDDLFPCEEELFELGCLYMRANQVDPPTNINECKALYLGLRQWLLSHL
ncbi:Hypothetical predicted protein [Mytilus galloprovincialis]|uniref:Integrase core domain-containing protein n=1 Tax=Mytilus galloprovincialis TaxID=29158 RepID=A0A8B6HKC8_MYTGA|nr:Hypothetical predicted protein [Mytilus galloprovincialis]